MYRRNLSLLIIFLLFSPMLISESVFSAQTEKTYVIIFDEGHNQFFDHELMSTALSGLNDSYDSDSLDVTINLIINKGNFNSTNLQGADALIISNPGFNDKGETNVKSNEKGILEKFVSDGNGILYMGNPFSYNTSFAGHGDALNDLVVTSLRATFKLGQGVLDTDNTTIILDDFNNDGNNSHIYFDNSQIITKTLANEMNIVNRVLYYGGSIDELLPSKLYGNTSSLTYTVDQKYDIRKDDLGEVRWFSAKESGPNNGRSLAIGSTIMFSDTPYSATENWVDMEDNNLLFQNFVAYLLKITPLYVPAELVEDDFGFFLGSNIFYGILIGGGFIAIIFAVLIYSKILDVTKIFNVKIAKVGSKNKRGDKATTKATTKNATTKKRSRRKRN